MSFFILYTILQHSYFSVAVLRDDKIIWITLISYLSGLHHAFFSCLEKEFLNQINISSTDYTRRYSTKKTLLALENKAAWGNK